MDILFSIYSLLMLISISRVYSWGVGQYGQLGHGDTVRERVMPHLIDGMRGRHVVDSSCGATHSLMVLGNGEVVAFGDNSKGQLGVKSVEEQVFTPLIIPTLLSVKIIACSCGAAHSVVLTDSGRAFRSSSRATKQLSCYLYSQNINVYAYKHITNYVIMCSPLLLPLHNRSKILIIIANWQLGCGYEWSTWAG